MEEDFDMPPPEEMMNDEEMDFADDAAPVMKVGDEKEIGKQGLKKKLLKEGEGWDTPDNGDEVEGFALALLFPLFDLLGNRVFRSDFDIVVHMDLDFSALYWNIARWN